MPFFLWIALQHPHLSAYVLILLLTSWTALFILDINHLLILDTTTVSFIHISVMYLGVPQWSA